MVAFNFSVGDFLAVARLLWKLCQTLDEFSKDAKELHKVQLELLSFHSAILSIERLLSTDVTLSEEHIAQLGSICQNCQEPIEEFDEHVVKYKPDRADSNGTRWLKRARWAFAGGKNVEPFRRMVQSYSTTLMLIMASANYKAVQDLGQEMQSSQRGLIQQVRVGNEDIKLQIYAALGEPWDKKPIRFQDAIGRRYPIPLEVCKTFQGLLSFLTFAFKDSPVLDAIKRSEVWLFSPVKEGSKQWNLIWGEDWEEVAEPAMQLGMSLVGHEGCKAATNDAQCIFDQALLSEDDSVIRFQKPLPQWSSYPDNVEFKFRSQRSIPPWVGKAEHATEIGGLHEAPSKPESPKKNTRGVLMWKCGFDDTWHFPTHNSCLTCASFRQVDDEVRLCPLAD